MISRALCILAALFGLSACGGTYETAAAVDEVSVTNLGETE